MEGHFFLTSLISMLKVPEKTCQALRSSLKAASGQLCLCAVVGSVSRSALWRREDSGKEAVQFLRVFHVSVS